MKKEIEKREMMEKKEAKRSSWEDKKKCEKMNVMN